jgi:hypothetical protein
MNKGGKGKKGKRMVKKIVTGNQESTDQDNANTDAVGDVSQDLNQSGLTDADTSFQMSEQATPRDQTGGAGEDVNSTKNLGAEDINLSTGRSFQDEEEKKSETASSKGGLAAKSHDASITATQADTNMASEKFEKILDSLKSEEKDPMKDWQRPADEETRTQNEAILKAEEEEKTRRDEADAKAAAEAEVARLAEVQAQKARAHEEEKKRVQGKIEYYTSEVDSFNRELSSIADQLSESTAKSTRDELETLLHKVTNSLNPLEADFPLTEYDDIEELAVELKKIPESKLSISDQIRAKIGEASLLVKHAEE